jgi:hypothetical protein
MCNNMTIMLIVMIIIWFLSCFTSFAINQNDFQREFGEMVSKNQEFKPKKINESEPSELETAKAK